MKPYAKEHCTNPRSHYHTAQDVLEDNSLSDSEKEFAEFASHCNMPDKYTSEIRAGLIDDEIIKAANESDASLIVVGSDEKTWLGGILSTDVAREVSGKAKRPVLVIPAQVSEHA